jgi:hypothetical protein
MFERWHGSLWERHGMISSHFEISVLIFLQVGWESLGEAGWLAVVLVYRIWGSLAACLCGI